MKSPETKTQTLNDEQVESNIREWEDSADKLEKMTAAEAKRFVGGKRPVFSRFLQMTVNMANKIRKEAPSKDAERRMLAAWKRRTLAYHKMVSMLAASVPTTSTIVTTASELESCTYKLI